MSAPTGLLVVACSATKRDPGWLERGNPHAPDRQRPVSAYNLYDGPAWRTLRPRLDRLLDTGCDVWVLSARHGLVPHFTQMTMYDQVLETDVQAETLCARTWTDPMDPVFFVNRTARVRDALLFGSRLYGRAFDAFLARAACGGLPLHYTRTSGGIGDQLGQLRRWIDTRIGVAA